MKLSQKTKDVLNTAKYMSAFLPVIAAAAFLCYLLSQPQPWDLTRELFIQKMQSVSATVDENNTVTYGVEKVTPETYIVATGNMKDFTIEYHEFKRTVDRDITFAAIKNEWMNKLFNEYGGFQEIGNEGGPSGKAYNSMFYKEYSVKINEEIYRVFIDEHRLVKVRVGAQYDADEISRTLFVLMEYK